MWRRPFGESDSLFEDIFDTQPVNHCPLEPQAALAMVDPSGKVTSLVFHSDPFLSQKESGNHPRHS